MRLFFMVPMVLALSTQAGVAGSDSTQFFNDADRNNDQVVTLAEFQRQRNIDFKKIDRNHDNVLSVEEMGARSDLKLIQRNASSATPRNKRKLFKRLRKKDNNNAATFNDKNGDGSITYAEWVNDIPAWFAELDTDGNGVISRAEINKS